MYCETILPLPLYGTYTYSLPEDSEKNVQIGSRVLVQFGRKKYYTGIVYAIHNEKPAYEVKPILSVLDKAPVVRYPQLKLWNWISEYYLCSIGDVYKAAIPSGLKLESETYISLNEEFGNEDGVKLTERQAIIVMILEEKGKMRISDIEAETPISNIGKVVSQMLELGIVNIDERIVERYRPRKESIVRLCAQRGEHHKLHDFIELTQRSQRQEQALMAWLDLSGWLHPQKEERDVTREDMMKIPGFSPSILKALIDKKIFKIEKRIVNRFNKQTNNTNLNLATLSNAQDAAFEQIKSGFREKQTMLLHGLTGSGKTEIYTHLIAAALKDNRQVLYLVPEISLTTQLTDRLRDALGDRLIVYHSKFSDNERVDIWKKILTSHEPMVVLGARSAVFLPFAQLGLVIVDEEHESSYKQYDPAPRYNARDTSIMLAMMHGAKVLLGSATPSIETYYKALTGKYGLVELTERFQGAELPEVEIVDMREQRKKKMNSGILSSTLRQQLNKSIESGKQAILFQNRRGFAPVVVCKQCGWTPKCENCDVSQVYHKHINTLKCHYCGFSRQLPALCPACGENSIEIYGYGTERISEEVKKFFPKAKISRMDLDTTRNKDSYQEIIEEFARHDTDILVGTQMVSKGLDFGDVKSVGVINADTLLNFPDFRSNERAFNMLEQVAGRAGRRSEKGVVTIQTTDPSNPILSRVKTHDYQGYYKEEIEERKRYNYPPFTKVINIYIRNKDSRAANRAAILLTNSLRAVFGSRVLGPEQPFVSRVALWYIESIMLKVESAASMKKVKDLLRQIYESIAASSDIKSSQIYYDVDPA